MIPNRASDGSAKPVASASVTPKPADLYSPVLTKAAMLLPRSCWGMRIPGPLTPPVHWPAVQLFCRICAGSWKVNRKLVLNLGLRWETNLPPTGLDDRWSDFSPTRANPGAGGIPGVVIFAGSGTGREGSRSLVPGYYGAFGPHIGFAYSLK
jgi:hypothetical protein